MQKLIWTQTGGFVHSSCAISIQRDRWVKLACEFRTSPTYDNTRGIDKTDWIRVNREIYDTCLDPRDYRPRESNP